MIARLIGAEQEIVRDNYAVPDTTDEINVPVCRRLRFSSCTDEHLVEIIKFKLHHVEHVVTKNGITTYHIFIRETPLWRK